MNTAVAKELLVAGAEIGGGFFAGRFFIADVAYGLIVSAKAEGDFEPMPWNQSTKIVKGALSYNDGRANTIAMAKAGSKVAEKIIELRIGGCDDWHLMSRQEALMAFYELQEVEAFKPGGPEAFEEEWYWTSTQAAYVAAYAWCQYFGYGGQFNFHKDRAFRARAVRVIPL